MTKLLFLLGLFFSFNFTFAAKIDTLNFFSKCMNKNIRSYIILPENYSIESQIKYPTLYLLHGYGGDCSSFITDFPQNKKYVDQYNMIIISVDGGFSSWYFDSPIDSTYKYETYIINELIPQIDSKYLTINSKSGRAISGLSMGGHGAMFLAMKHSTLFGAAGSMSGGLDIRPFPQNWDLEKRLGNQSVVQNNWDQNTAINQIDKISNNTLSLLIDCGVDDFFITVNRNFHQQLLEKSISHDYIERAGGHDMNYWLNSIDYQLFYFNQFFLKNN